MKRGPNKNPSGGVVAAITALLTEHGELTRAEMVEMLGDIATAVPSVLSRMNKASKRLPKRVYIIRWTREDSSDTRPYRKAVFALGDKPDVPRKTLKRITQGEATKAWRHRERSQINSVWALGMTRTKRREARIKAVEEGATVPLVGMKPKQRKEMV